MTRQRLASLAFLSTMAAVAASAGVELLPEGCIPEPRRPDGPPNRTREEARRRRQLAARGLPVAEPVVVDPSARVGTHEEGGKR
ncbi:hypothetical protein [Sorangium sp. So ce1024]|uniref:hypothetical protein n=1 Tax=Sorangium sp. So ce1024 TaxID=3133327 RepID=UPI003F0A2049